MVELAIRCHRCVPLSADELQRWLEELLFGLRESAPHAAARLSRLTQQLPSREVDIGWLLELSVPTEEIDTVRQVLAEALRDMRLTGLQPTLLAPVEMCEPQFAGGLEVGGLPHIGH